MWLTMIGISLGCALITIIPAIILGEVGFPDVAAGAAGKKSRVFFTLTYLSILNMSFAGVLSVGYMITSW